VIKKSACFAQSASTREPLDGDARAPRGGANGDIVTTLAPAAALADVIDR